MDEWGSGQLDPGELPYREYAAHLAILEGRGMRRRELQQEMERNSKK